jgi:ankyrin repeat protein
LNLLKIKNIVIFLVLSISAKLVFAAEIPYLLTSASKGDVATVKAILDSGANVDTKDENDITALMYAARKDNADVVKLLLEKGAAINAKDKGGWTALMFAAKKNHVNTVKVLLEKGADPKFVMKAVGAHSAWRPLLAIQKLST